MFVFGPSRAGYDTLFEGCLGCNERGAMRQCRVCDCGMAHCARVGGRGFRQRLVLCYQGYLQVPGGGSSPEGGREGEGRGDVSFLSFPHLLCRPSVSQPSSPSWMKGIKQTRNRPSEQLGLRYYEPNPKTKPDKAAF